MIHARKRQTKTRQPRKRLVPDGYTRRLVTKATRLLAFGKSRQEVATLLNVAPERITRWEKWYPELWKTAVPGCIPIKGIHGRRNSLILYFYDHFIEEKLFGRSVHTLGNYRKALVRLCCYVGYDITLAEVTDALVEDFTEALICDGLTPDTARKYRCYVRAVVRHARPGTCLKASGQRPHESVAVGLDDREFDTEGSLMRFFREVYLPQRLVGCSDGTVQQHVIALRRFCKHLGRPVMVAELTDELVAGHLQSMLDHGLSRVTANSARGSILANWRLAYKKKLIGQLPSLDKLKTFRRLPEAWTLEEIGRLLTAAAATPGMIGHVRARDFWPALILLLFDTGLRRKAAMSIQCDDVDLDTRWIVVRAETQKEKNEQRYQLSQQTIEALRPLWFRGLRLFYYPSRVRSLNERLGRILCRAGLPNGPKDKFHKIRRTTASHIAKAAGAEAAARQLGHAAVDVTRRYIDPTIARSEVDGVVHLPRPQIQAGNGEQAAFKAACDHEGRAQ